MSASEDRAEARRAKLRAKHEKAKRDGTVHAFLAHVAGIREDDLQWAFRHLLTAAEIETAFEFWKRERAERGNAHAAMFDTLASLAARTAASARRVEARHLAGPVPPHVRERERQRRKKGRWKKDTGRPAGAK